MFKEIENGLAIVSFIAFLGASAIAYTAITAFNEVVNLI